MTCSLLDSALDLSVTGGYTNVGHRMRSRGWKPPPRMEGEVVLITGATSGLGLAAAGGFARLGATVWLAVRNRERGEAARARILGHQSEADVHVEVCDLSRSESVRRFAERFTGEARRLDVLVNTAGVLPQGRELSADGIELTLATNLIGPFLLTQLLIPVLERSAPSRILNVSSGGMYVTVQAMHPGWADTAGLESSLPRFHRATRPLLRSAEQGADTIVWLGAAAEPADSSGGFWRDRRRRPTHAGLREVLGGSASGSVEAAA